MRGGKPFCEGQALGRFALPSKLRGGTEYFYRQLFARTLVVYVSIVTAKRAPSAGRHGARKKGEWPKIQKVEGEHPGGITLRRILIGLAGRKGRGAQAMSDRGSYGESQGRRGPCQGGDHRINP